MNEQNKLVYHYCSVDTFNKIVSNKELWLTDVTKSNDYEELQAIFNVLSDKIKSKIDFKNIGIERSISSLLLRDFINCIDLHSLLFHVCCFSEDADSLSQWAMYANNATGIAIGFDSNKFKNLKSLTFSKVDYTMDKQIHTIDEKIEQIINDYKEDNVLLWFYGFIDYIMAEVLNKCFLFKNSSFEQEHEHRLVFNSRPIYFDKINGLLSSGFIKDEKIISNEFQIGKIEFFSSRERLVSFRRLKIKNIGSVIKEIVIGPKSLIDKNDIEKVLLLNGLTEYVKIKKSNSSYR